MWGVCNFLLVWSLASGSELFDLLSTTDKFFDEFQIGQDSNPDPSDIRLMVKRTYELNAEKRLFKRSAAQNDMSTSNKGVYLLDGIVDVAQIPAKFTNDINPFSLGDVLIFVALESNKSNPEIRLANDMVLYQYSPASGISELDRVPVHGGTRTTIHFFRNTVYVLAAEHDASVLEDSFEGSVLYKIKEGGGRVTLEKIQILNVIEPNCVEFWEHQDELYLAIGANAGNDTLRTGTLIYRWMGHHFDCIQRIDSKSVKSLTPFSIGSFMYLAVANFQDENGNTDIHSDIYKFHWDNFKFQPYQKIKTHGAHHFAHFKFEEDEVHKSEHFLVVANYIGKNSNGALTSYLESVAYKFNGNIFVPFQSFKLLGATQWLPVQGSKGEFLLLVSHSNGLRGFQYDGWRFSQVSLKFNQSALGEDIQSIRAAQYLDDIFLTISDKSSHGEDVNLWKLSFENENDLEEKRSEIETWCRAVLFNLTQDDFTDSIERLKMEAKQFSESKKLQMSNLKAIEPQMEAVREMENLSAQARYLNEMLDYAEDKMEERNHDIPILIGSKMIPHLEIKCKTSNCVVFENVVVSKLNGEDFPDFLNDVVYADRYPLDRNIYFEKVSVENDLSVANINGHPSATLIDVCAESFINSELVINGTVFVEDDLNVHGLFDGAATDENPLLLFDDDQVIDGKLTVDTLTVDNLKLGGNINRHSIEDLLRQPEIRLQKEYDELKINNLVVDGYVDGYDLSLLLELAEEKFGNRKIPGNIDIDSIEAEEVIVDSDEISGVPIDEFMSSNPCLIPSNATGEQDEKMKFRSNRGETEKYEDNEIIIVVEGVLKAKDISDKKGSESLMKILNESYRIDESVVNDSIIFLNVAAKSIQTKSINGSHVDSWILKNSQEPQEISGEIIFIGDVYIDGEVNATKINGIDLKEMEESSLNLQEEDEVMGDWIFDTIIADEISANFTDFGNYTFDKLSGIVVADSASIDFFQADNLIVKGMVDSVSWIDLVEDSVFDSDDFVEGSKNLKGVLRVDNLNLKGRINDLLLDELIKLGSKHRKTIVLDRNVSLDVRPLIAEEMTFEGTLDSILTPRFHEEWMLQGESQIISVPVEFDNLKLKSPSNLKNDTINNVNLRKLFTKSIKLNEDAELKYLYALDDVKVGIIELGGTVNGADFKSSVLRGGSKLRQDLSGYWLLHKDLIINGSLSIEGFLSGLNVSLLCGENESGKVNLLVGGGVRFEKEPKITKVNGIDLEKKTRELWMGNEDVTLTGSDMTFGNVRLENETILSGYLNHVNLTLFSNNYMSKEKSQVVSGDIELDKLVIRKWCRARKVSVKGLVNGIDLSEWSKGILLQGEDQIIRGRLSFNVFEASDVESNGTVNKLDLWEDVLRFDKNDSILEGEKTFEGIRVINLTVAAEKKIQGVDVDAWRKDLVVPNGNMHFKGNVMLDKADFMGPVAISGKVNNVTFDSHNLVTKNGYQRVSGVKNFELPNGGRVNSTMKIKNLRFWGLIDGLDVDSLMKNQAYSDEDLVFTERQTFIRGFASKVMEVSGTFQGVNVTEMCFDVFNPEDANVMEKGFVDLTRKTDSLIEMARGRAYYFDYFEAVQTLKPNVKAVVPCVDKKGHYLAVLTSSIMRFMIWNEYFESFVNAGDSLSLTDNITFVTSVGFENDSLLYIESPHSSKVLMSDRLQDIEGGETSCVTYFRLNALNKSCIFIGQKQNSSRILCGDAVTSDLTTYQWLESKGSVQATALMIDDDTYLAVINQEEIVDKFENSLTIYRFDSELRRFLESHVLAEVNPVAVSSIDYNGNHYLVSAGGHIPESVHNSVVSIFRFNKHHKVFVRSKSIQVDTPVDVHFALLPSSELALYVLTSNPTKPLIVYLYRGIAGFVEETSGLSLYPGSNVNSFTDSENRHFVVITGFGRGQILKAGFKGETIKQNL